MISEEKREGDQKCMWRNYSWKLPKPKEGNRYPGTESTEGPKQDETRHSPRHIIIKVAKDKDKERFLHKKEEKERESRGF